MFSVIAAFLCSFLLAVSSPGVHFPYTAWVALVPLLYAATKNRPKKAFALGFLAGIPYYTFLLSWVTISLGTYGYLPWWISYPALLLLASYMSLYTACFCFLTSLTKKIDPVWTAPFIWVGLDFLRGFLFTGFPWQDLGYTQYNTPLLIQTADLFGHHGVTFLLILVNSFIFSLITRPRLLTLAYSLLIITAAMSYSYARLHYFEKEVSFQQFLSVSIIQPNIAQDTKWFPHTRETAINTLADLSSQAVAKQDSDLVVWPETAIPVLGTETTNYSKIK